MANAETSYILYCHQFSYWQLEPVMSHTPYLLTSSQCKMWHKASFFNAGRRLPVDPVYTWSGLFISPNETLLFGIASSGFLTAQRQREFDKSGRGRESPLLTYTGSIHPHSLYVLVLRRNFCSDSFFFRTVTLLNRLPRECFQITKILACSIL